MKIKIEEIESGYLFYVGKECAIVQLADLENLGTHLEYYLNNDNVKELEIEIGG